MIRDSVRVRWLLTVRRIRIDRGPAWPRSPSASVAIDWDVAVTLAQPSFQPLYAALVSNHSTLLFIVAPEATASMGWLLISA